jgi:serine/threonine protein kinase
MGIVLKGRDPDLGRDVAMKVLHPAHAENPALIQRFIEEAQVGGQLQHPGILPVYELGLDAERRPYFTMRLVKGRTLAALLEERPEPGHDLGRFLGIFQQAGQTVAYAHARGVIHRDLKPANIMVGAFGEVQVVDWGLAKVLHQGAEAQGGSSRPPEADEAQVATVRSTGGGSPSQSGSILGTPAYMSPEQARGDVEGLDEQTDVFALGAILCEILAGRPPLLRRPPEDPRRRGAGPPRRRLRRPGCLRGGGGADPARAALPRTRARGPPAQCGGPRPRDRGLPGSVRRSRQGGRDRRRRGAGHRHRRAEVEAEDRRPGRAARARPARRRRIRRPRRV